MRNDDEWLQWVCTQTGARTATVRECIQSLWSGYGEIQRIELSGATAESIVAKRVAPPTASHHPRGWNTSRSHERKLRSYAVEGYFYENWASHCRGSARVPQCIATRTVAGDTTFLLEDVDASGYAGRRHDVTDAELVACLHWLADFHASFLGVSPEGLWPIGTYWHLATRPDELAALQDPRLRAAAPILDAKLNASRFRTFVHGDAKVANFCFGADGVAAVDFQYVGGGAGIKDVAYFLSSCMTEHECERRAAEFLDVYFQRLTQAVDPSVDARALETEWRGLYPIAWADFYRFLAGWSPDHWKIHGYSDRLTREVLDGLELP